MQGTTQAMSRCALCAASTPTLASWTATPTQPRTTAGRSAWDSRLTTARACTPMKLSRLRHGLCKGMLLLSILELLILPLPLGHSATLQVRQSWTCVGRKIQQGKMLSEWLPCGGCTLAHIAHTATLSAPRAVVVGTRTTLLTPCTAVLRLTIWYWHTGAQGGVAARGRGMCWRCCRHSYKWMPRQNGVSQRATRWCSTPSSSCRHVTHFRMPATDMKARGGVYSNQGGACTESKY